jgi:hypothetical protein
MSDQNQKNQQGGQGGQQRGGGQKPGQGGQQQTEVDKKRERWREIGRKQEEVDKKSRDMADGQEPDTSVGGT